MQIGSIYGFSLTNQENRRQEMQLVTFKTIKGYSWLAVSIKNRQEYYRYIIQDCVNLGQDATWS
jgi:hypothetical protein